MKCSRCHFENMPGQDRCFKCGSVLEAAEGAVDVHPPRMARWRRPFRVLRRWSRRHQRVTEKLPTGHVGRAWDAAVSDASIGFVLGIVPGLPYALNGRFREVRWFVLTWFLMLSIGLFLYGSTPGSLLIGLAIGLHAWLSLRYGLLETAPGFFQKLGLILMAIVVLGVIYWSTPRIFLRGFTGGHTALTIPAMQVHRGDYFFVRAIDRSEEPLPRGTLVLIHPRGVRNNQMNMFRQHGSTLGQLIGRPGEVLTIAGDSYAVDDRPLDPNRYPVPGWLAGRALVVPVPSGKYFVSTPYTMQAHGNVRLANNAIRNVCLVDVDEIGGRAFIQWWPLRRRGFIE